MRVGLDIDGVLADFNQAYVATVIDVTGKDLFPGPYGTFDITTWNYPESYGYTATEVSKVWALIKESEGFWVNLRPYKEVQRIYQRLYDITCGAELHDVYFITSRPGKSSKIQTEAWLAGGMQIQIPTVLISSDKGACARALNLDLYIDDRTENCADVVALSPRTRCFMLARTWNEHVDSVERVSTLDEFFAMIQ